MTIKPATDEDIAEMRRTLAPRYSHAFGATAGDVKGLIATIDTLRERLATAEAELIRWRSAVQTLTPGGSEFTTPEAVLAFVQQQRADRHETICRSIRAQRAVESERDTLRHEVERLKSGEPVAWRVRVQSDDPEEWTLLPAGGGADYLGRPGYEVQALYVLASEPTP